MHTTLVSALMIHVNKRKDRTIDDYLRYGKSFLEAPIYKIVFIDTEIYDAFTGFRNEWTTLVPFVKQSNYLYQMKDHITEFHLNTKTPEKDTLEYMFTMAHKTEWVKQAIEKNVYRSTHFAWVDFGIRHMCHCDEATFTKALCSLTKGETCDDKISMAAIWKPTLPYLLDIYKDIAWYFAGSVFGGPADMLLAFAQANKETTLDIIVTKKTLMWEVNVWYLVYLEHKNWFHLYSCDHNLSIFNFTF